MVKARVIYTLKHYLQLPKTLNPAGLIIALALTGSVMLLMLGIPVLTAISGDPLPEGFWSHLMLLAGAFLFYISIRQFFSPWLGYRKAHKKFGDTPVEFELREKDFTAVQTGEDFDENITLPYSKLDKVVETKDFFLLVSHGGNAFIIGKSEITEGTPEQLRSILRGNMGKKYKLK